MRILEAVNCCHAIANYMLRKDDSPKAGYDLHEVANLVQSLNQKLTEAEQSCKNCKSRERRYRAALVEIAEDDTCGYGSDTMYDTIEEMQRVAKQALQDIPEEQPQGLRNTNPHLKNMDDDELKEALVEYVKNTTEEQS